MSIDGYRHYLLLAGKECYFYVQREYKHNAGYDVYERVSHDQAKQEVGVVFCWTKDFGETLKEWPKDRDEHYFYCNNLERTDPLLIQTVEALGQKASGRFADLQVVEIPDGIEWHLDEYDGIESIHENHRSW